MCCRDDPHRRPRLAGGLLIEAGTGDLLYRGILTDRRWTTQDLDALGAGSTWLLPVTMGYDLRGMVWIVRRGGWLARPLWLLATPSGALAVALGRDINRARVGCGAEPLPGWVRGGELPLRLLGTEVARRYWWMIGRRD